MLDYTTPQAKKQKRKYVIDLTNSLLFKISPELLLISYSISYSVPFKGSLQALFIKWIPFFLKSKATKTFVQ